MELRKASQRGGAFEIVRHQRELALDKGSDTRICTRQVAHPTDVKIGATDAQLIHLFGENKSHSRTHFDRPDGKLTLAAATTRSEINQRERLVYAGD
jgi:hypothetical protein